LFYACSNKDCDFIIFGMISNKNITPQIVKEIIEKGKTKTIKGFTSKAGKKFNAKLKLTEKGVEFDFNKKK
ncbi:topoisomerase C-terminal repeat-containing protein, partial [Staphylococcus epidermidis]